MDSDGGPPLKPPDAAAPPSGSEQQQHQGQEDGKHPPPSLPDDALANIFGRLAPRCVAASRCVCRPWRAAIDARRLLRADLLPLTLRGIFLHFHTHKFPAFFARPGAGAAPALTGKLSFLPYASPAACAWRVGETYRTREKYAIKDHCNGLLLIDTYVVNPATRRWDALPPGPPGRVQFFISTDQDLLEDAAPVPEAINSYLLFDPTVSPHYQVLRICALSRMGSMDVLGYDDAQCPASSCTLNVLSSSTGCWEERRFVREGGTAGTVAEVQARPRSGAVYSRGALYVHCESHFVLRISLSSNTYRVIRPPPGYADNRYPHPYLQRSQNGVYFLSLDNYLLRVWILTESSSCGQMEWVLKHDIDLEPVFAPWCPPQPRAPWMLKGVNHNPFCIHFPEPGKDDMVQDKFEWSSDNGDVLENGDDDDVIFVNEGAIEECSSKDSKKAVLQEKFESNSSDDLSEERCWNEEVCELDMLGLHPFKEVLFLSDLASKGLAYHLNTSKIEWLGAIYPEKYHRSGGYRDEVDRVKYAFAYTPCWMEEFPTNS